MSRPQEREQSAGDGVRAGKELPNQEVFVTGSSGSGRQQSAATECGMDGQTWGRTMAASAPTPADPLEKGSISPEVGLVGGLFSGQEW